MEEMKIGEIFNKFYGELAIKYKISDTGRLYFCTTDLCFICTQILLHYTPGKCINAIPMASMLKNSSCWFSGANKIH